MSESGEILRSARQKRNWSLDDVSEATRIKVTFLDALENGDYGLLPGAAYVTGFLRNYASHLGLHPDDLVHQYHALRPAPPLELKAATRVLASGYERQNRTRLLWTLAAVVMLVIGGYAVKQYAQNGDAHAYSPPLNVTPANLGATAPNLHPAVKAVLVRVRLRASAPVWVHVTADGKSVFQGTMRPGHASKLWLAHRSIYVITYNGARLRATYDGHPVGRLAKGRRLTVQVATPTGWQKVS